MNSPATTTDRFAIISLPDHRTPDDAIVVGDLKEVFEYIPQSVARDDAIAGLEAARFTADQISSLQSKTRGVRATMLVDTIKHLDARLDALKKRRADAARARADAEREAEQKRIQQELDALPDPDNPDPPLPLRSRYPEPSLALEGDSAPRQSLRPIQPTFPGDPWTEPPIDRVTPGSLQMVPMKPVLSDQADQAEFPDPDEPDPLEYQQPIAAGLDRR